MAPGCKVIPGSHCPFLRAGSLQGRNSRYGVLQVAAGKESYEHSRRKNILRTGYRNSDDGHKVSQNTGRPGECSDL